MENTKRYRVSSTPDAVIAESETVRLVFPYHWQGFSRAYTYASISGSGPTQNGERMGLVTFMRWMPLLEDLSAADGATMEIVV